MNAFGLLLFFELLHIVYGNEKPVFTVTQPTTVFFDEGTNTPAGTSLYTFTATDSDLTLVYLSYEYDPVESSDMFEINETQTAGEITAEVKLKDLREFDYEVQNAYKIYARAYDGVQYSGLSGVLLNIVINDIGETPTLDPPTTSQSFSAEEGPAGSKIGDPSFVVVDADSAEIHTWTVTGGTGEDFVNVNVLNGTLTLRKTYDRENTALTEEVYVNISIADRFGLTVETAYYVTFSDTNDNIPTFSPSYYTFDMNNENISVGDVLVTLTYTDLDADSPNNEVTLSLDTSNSYTDYFELVESNITLSIMNDLVYGDGPFTFYVLATDDGDTPLTGTATIEFGLPTATDPTHTTTTLIPPQSTGGDEMASNTEMVGVMIACCFIAAVIISYLLVLCWRWHTYGQCLPNSLRSADCCSLPNNDEDEDEQIIASIPNVHGKDGSGLGKQYGNY
ncbi:protocadherin gamma-A2-like [Mya arenaria]|uniref:protocadherin gamma-A2-like n=1 Tax=Mya arenaria TaxID=6604 RepID=UPI0022E38AB1|nr:protocadherin gamma-A2-like [Mya arenaria]